MKAKKRIYQYVMLVASIVMLLSVVIPHHHHSNGLPCYKSVKTEAAHGGHGSSNSHDCGCNGHNVALYTSLLTHITDVDMGHQLFPLLVLFDYINPPEPAFNGQFSEREQSFYIETLHGTWITSASGLRAPPSFPIL